MIDTTIYVYIGFKTSFYVVRHLDSIASYLPTGLHLGFFRSWSSLYLPSSSSSVFLVLSFVSASTSMLFSVIFLLPFLEQGRTTCYKRLKTRYGRFVVIDKEFCSAIILYFNVRDETGSETSDSAYCSGPKIVMCTEYRCVTNVSR